MASNRASFWRYFFKMKRTNPHPSIYQADAVSVTDEMHTIQERTETSEQQESGSGGP